MPIAAHSRSEVMRHIQAHTREGAFFYTDEWQAYATLKVRGEHVVIRKEKGKPVGEIICNGIEGFWSYAKNWLYPYRGVSRKYFHLYLGEVCFRLNHQGQDLKPLQECQRFLNLCSERARSCSRGCPLREFFGTYRPSS